MSEHFRMRGDGKYRDKIKEERERERNDFREDRKTIAEFSACEV